MKYIVFVRFCSLYHTLKRDAREFIIEHHEFEAADQTAAHSLAQHLYLNGVRFQEGDSWLIFPPSQIVYIEVKPKAEVKA